MALPNNSNVADQNFPGKVLEPNDVSAFDDVIHNDNSSQFGTELEKPNTQRNAVPANDKRFEHWQSEATKAQNEVKALREQLAVIQPVMPLISVLQKDEALQGVVRNHLSGKNKPLEAPQRPTSYNEVEAYSNPESESFKYRIAYDKFRDTRIDSIQQENERLHQERQAQIEESRRASANQQALAKFQQEVIEMGVQPQEVPEFFNLVNNATPKEMVEFYNWKKGQSGKPRFEIPGGSFSARPSAQRETTGPIDISAEILAAARDYH